jgi:hypothetical protein
MAVIDGGYGWRLLMAAMNGSDKWAHRMGETEDGRWMTVEVGRRMTVEVGRRMSADEGRRMAAEVDRSEEHCG